MLTRNLIVALTMLASAAGQISGTSSNDSLKECLQQRSDIYFLLDSSDSMNRGQFEQLKEAVVSVVQRLDIGSEATRVGLGLFADHFSQMFGLGDHSSKSSLLRAVRGVSYQGGGSYTGKGLQGMRVTGFKEGVARENATKIGVVITDGKARHRTDVLRETSLLQERGVWMFALGVGNLVDREELSTFASQPHSEFLRHASSFADLSAGSLTSDLSLAICRLQPPQADNGTCGRKKNADILFVYNAAAMSQSNITYVEQFAEDLIKNFSMTSGNIRVGVVSEGLRGEDIALAQYIRKEELVAAMKRRSYPDLSLLLRKVRQHSFVFKQGGRSRASKVAILFLHDANVSTDALVQARMAASRVTIYVLGAGLSGDLDRVQQLPLKSDLLFQFSSYAAMVSQEGDKEKKKFQDKLCGSL